MKIKLMRVKFNGASGVGGVGTNHNFIVKPSNPYYEWYKSNTFYRCKEFEVEKKDVNFPEKEKNNL